MNYIVFLDTQAGELEKILSGIKCMVLKEFNTPLAAGQTVRPGDSLFFIRDNGERTLRVRATVVQATALPQNPEERLSQTLKELQLKLQLNEDQYSHWSSKQKVLLVEFTGARKIKSVNITTNRPAGGPEWIAFDEFNSITE